MKTITPRQALRESQYAIVTRNEPCHVYDLYPDEDTARCIASILNRRYGDIYEVAVIDFERGA